jgi:hypothetical protein
MWNDTCTSDGACGDPDKKYIGEENEYSGE